MRLTLKGAVVLFLILLALSLIALAQPDSLKVKGTTGMQSVHVPSVQTIELPGLAERLTILMIGTMAVGGLGLLLNAMRKRLVRGDTEE